MNKARIEDLVAIEDKAAIARIDKTKRCPFLRNFGIFYYCGNQVADDVEITLDVDNPIVRAYVSPAKLDRSCFDKCCDCAHYKGTYKPRQSSES